MDQATQVLKKVEEVAVPNTDFIDVEKQIPKLLNQRYELKEELGKGAHGRIYSGRDKLNKSLIAVKIMDKITKNKSKYIREISLMKDMNKTQQLGFPKLQYYASDKIYQYIVMEQLGQSLKELKDQCPDHKFTLKTVTMIGLQLLLRLESIHKLNYIHRDLKPANIMIGRNKSDQHVIYLIDFGLTKKQNQISNIPHNEAGNKVVGTAIYAGINAHLPSSNYYKKDDLESMMYVLCYLYTGTLPWKNCKPTDSGLDKMMKLKLKVSPYDLFYQMPIEFAQILEHIKTTLQEAQCDYRYIETLLKSVAYNQKFKIDYNFDWLLLKKPDRKTLDTAGNNYSSMGVNNVMRDQSSKSFVQYQQHETLKMDSSVVHFDAQHVESVVSLTKQCRNRNESNKELRQELEQNCESMTIGQHNRSKLSNDFHIAAMPNLQCNEDQGGLALPVIQEKLEEEKFSDSQLVAMSQEKDRKKHKKSKVKDKTNKYSKLLINNSSSAPDKDGKIDINVTVNINNNQDQQDSHEQVVQMTINRSDVVNVHVHISGSNQGLTHQQSLKLSALREQEANQDAIEPQQNPLIVDEPMHSIDEMPLETNTFEEFESGILSEASDMIASQDVPERKLSFDPRFFQTHSNLKKMKFNIEERAQTDEIRASFDGSQ